MTRIGSFQSDVAHAASHSAEHPSAPATAHGGESPLKPPDGYKVGPGKPPYEHRFPPGRSGNPSGRPRKLKTVADDLHDALKERVPIKNKGRSRTITVQALILRNLARDAARGNLGAARLLLVLVARYELSNETEVHVGDLEAEDRAILKAYVSAAREAGDQLGDEG